MKYHGLKMEEVNDTMKHLWNKTYQGTGMFCTAVLSSVIHIIHVLQISTALKLGLTSKAAHLTDPIIIEYVTP